MKLGNPLHHKTHSIVGCEIHDNVYNKVYKVVNVQYVKGFGIRTVTGYPLLSGRFTNLFNI